MSTARQPDDLVSGVGVGAGFTTGVGVGGGGGGGVISCVWRAMAAAPQGQFLPLLGAPGNRYLLVRTSVSGYPASEDHVRFLGGTNLGSGADLRFGFIWTESRMQALKARAEESVIDKTSSSSASAGLNPMMVATPSAVSATA